MFLKQGRNLIFISQKTFAVEMTISPHIHPQNLQMSHCLSYKCCTATLNSRENARVPEWLKQSRRTPSSLLQILLQIFHRSVHWHNHRQRPRMPDPHGGKKRLQQIMLGQWTVPNASNQISAHTSPYIKINSINRAGCKMAHPCNPSIWQVKSGEASLNHAAEILSKYKQAKPRITNSTTKSEAKENKTKTKKKTLITIMKYLRYDSKGTRSKRKKLDIIKAIKTVMVE